MSARTGLCVLALAAWSAATGQSATRHMLFRVRGPAGATVYLLGSVHLLDSTAATLPPVVDSAFAHARTIVFETSLDSVMMRGMELIASARYPAGKSLQTELSPAALAKTDSLLASYGLSATQLAGFKPWFLSLLLEQTVMQRAGYEARYGVDEQLHARAKARGKPEGGLESVDFQLHLFDSLSPADQEKLLLEAEPPDSAARELTRVRDAWRAGDTATLDRTLNKSTAADSALFAALVTNRNRNWLPKIEAMLRGSEDALVVVGAGHLVGKQGLVALLEQAGYRVEQL